MQKKKKKKEKTKCSCYGLMEAAKDIMHTGKSEHS